MEKQRKLLDALQECGEAAAIYKGQNFLAVNGNLAGLFETNPEDLAGKSINTICHEESIEMMQDFIHRRIHHDRDVPTSYECAFTTPSNPKVVIKVIAVPLKNCDGAVLVILKNP